MKKTLVASAITLAFGSSINVEAGTAGLTGVWNGTYTMGFHSAGIPGGPIGTPTSPQAWKFNFNNGTVDIVNTQTFYGSVWTAHDVTFSDDGGGTYSGSMLWDWDGSTAPIVMTWDITDAGIITALASQITANSPIFPGFTPVFEGTISAVPIPASAWLLGSGLIGLIGIARRKKV